jgi:putative endonuclease
MCFVCVLRSLKNNKRYVGYTRKDVQVRLQEHNTGSSRWTRQNGPFDLVYVDECLDVKEAKSWEKFLKSGQGRQCLDELGI